MGVARGRSSQAAKKGTYLPALHERIRQLEGERAGADLRGDLVALTATRDFLLSHAAGMDLPELARALAQLVVTKGQVVRAQAAAEMVGYVSPEAVRTYVERLMALCRRYVPEDRHEAFVQSLRVMIDDTAATS